MTKKCQICQKHPPKHNFDRRMKVCNKCFYQIQNGRLYPNKEQTSNRRVVSMENEG